MGSGKRMTFGEKEVELNEWMGANAVVAWQVCEQPWLTEEQLIRELSFR